MSGSVLPSAILYAELGWLVFPCWPRSKKPATKHGRNDATADLGRIRRWWAWQSRANVAIATGPESGVLVLDIDRPKPDQSVDGLDTIRALIRDHGALPITVGQRTGSGGWQLFFRYPAGRHITISAGKTGAGLDTRGRGGYVVAPPSIHPNGRRYTWLAGRGPDERPLAEAPAWLIDLLDPPEVARTSPPVVASGFSAGPGRALDGLLRAVATAPAGRRNDLLNWAAFKAAALDVPRELLSRRLTEAAIVAGLPEIEASMTIRSAFRARGIED